MNSTGWPLRIIVGLGNPGPEHQVTRHNAGFWFVDQLARRHGGEFRDYRKFSGETAKITVAGQELTLLKPTTYMNRSGSAVSALLNWLKAEPAQLLVVVDDADLPLGQIRLRASGGSGGHNGLRSIIETLGGNEEFARLRVGIGRSAPMGADITGHVLGKFAPQERERAEQAVATAAEAIECCLRDGLTEAMNQFNRKQSAS